MKHRFPLRVSLLAVILMASCAPAVSPPNPPADVTQPPVSTQPPTLALTATIVQPSAIQPTATEAAQVLPIATSRGPNLEAVDPTTVKLDSGGLQFVEFFRFT